MHAVYLKYYLLLIISFISLWVFYRNNEIDYLRQKKIDCLFESFVVDGCQFQSSLVSGLGTKRIAIQENDHLSRFIDRLKKGNYEVVSGIYGVPACGDKIMINTLDNNEYYLWISHFGTFILPNDPGQLHEIMRDALRDIGLNVSNSNLRDVVSILNCIFRSCLA